MISGQAHAINKGLALVTGDIVAYINSDDLYLPGAFAAVVKYFRAHPRCKWVCGDSIASGEGDCETSLAVAEVPRSACSRTVLRRIPPLAGTRGRTEVGAGVERVGG